MNNIPARSAVLAVALLLSFSLAGCGGGGSGSTTTPPPPPPTPMEGTVQDGQQPVSGATIQLYAASTAGYGAAAVPLITASSKSYPVVSNASGKFTIAGDFTCPAGAQVYITATGGNPGSGVNPALALMSALGSCSTLAANGTSTPIMVNELTTVSSVWALAPFMSGAASVGTSATNLPGLVRAFAAVNKLVSTTTGTLSGPALPTGAILPLSEIDTLADILASCVKSDGGTTSGTACGTLFAAATVGSAVPADTIAAALNIARNPGQNVASLCALASSSSPFQPILGCATPPNAWTIAIQYTGGGLSAPRAIVADANGNLWLPNSHNNSVTELDNTGSPLSGGTGFTSNSLNAPSALALDLSGNAWVANAGNNTVTMIPSQGTSSSSFSGGGLDVPQSIAFDAGGNAWIANLGNSSLTELGSNGSPLSPSGSGFTGAGIHQPSSIAINPH